MTKSLNLLSDSGVKTAMTEPKHAKSSLLIRDIHTLITMDAHDTVLRGGFIYTEGGEIKQVGKRPPARLRADRTISARYAVALPGLINTHHHLCQTLTRACAAAADMELFDWLRTLYPLWARLEEESDACGRVGGHGGVAALRLHDDHGPSLSLPSRPNETDRCGNCRRAQNRHAISSHAGKHECGQKQGRPAAGFRGAERRRNPGGLRAADSEISRSRDRVPCCGLGLRPARRFPCRKN